MSMSIHHQIPLDPNKRHFVVGDVHGRYEALLNLLEEINYDDTTDMIYSVGDVIDRGPQSVEVIKFFQQPNTHVARGNHEQMIINQKDWKSVWLHPPHGGPATLASLAEHNLDMNWLEQFCNKLPVCLDVGDTDQEGAFRVIHAELPPRLSEDDFCSYLIEHPDDAAEGEMLWGRRTINQAKRNIEHMLPAGYGVEFHPNWTTRNVFCGHTPIERSIRVGNMWWLDTWKSKTMSMINAITFEKFVVPVLTLN